MINQDFNTILELLQAFPNEQTCIDHLETIRWNGVVVSPFDASSKAYKCKGNKYKCKNTGKYFNVRTQTLFDNTKIPLQKWMLAIWLITSHKKGISSLQLSRDIGVTQKTAWFLLHRIRNCYGMESTDAMKGEIEADETYVGGKETNRHFSKRTQGSTGRSTKTKTPVVGMVERGGNVAATVVEDVKAKSLHAEIKGHVEAGATVYTDEWQGYKGLNKVYDHQVIKHSEGKYVNGRIHTNTIEGFWSLLKRGIIGIYHFTSEKHLQKYVDEFVFRYNRRDEREGDRVNQMLSLMGHRLTYRALIAKEEAAI